MDEGIPIEGCRKFGKRNFMHHRKRTRKRMETRQTINKLTYNPAKHKNKFRRELRLQLREKRAPNIKSIKLPSSELKFGSFNVDGLGLDAAFAAVDLLHSRKFDVSITLIFNIFYYQRLRFLLSVKPMEELISRHFYLLWTALRCGIVSDQGPRRGEEGSP